MRKLTEPRRYCTPYSRERRSTKCRHHLLSRRHSCLPFPPFHVFDRDSAADTTPEVATLAAHSMMLLLDPPRVDERFPYYSHAHSRIVRVSWLLPASRPSNKSPQIDVVHPTQCKHDPRLPCLPLHSPFLQCLPPGLIWVVLCN